ncbi:serine/threonine protein kinase [Nocardia uniformis]|uniref:Serine/threonine protein kinase n=1 Tax=Nocardia uniformis TaxID=53432 RepID=A0A849BZV2_9NOCA|nr:serine/threonine-protein kinase [Nocardia uniformis]NNH69167.1 serine/threonine protein kinase [Nocardia uniformis]
MLANDQLASDSTQVAGSDDPTTVFTQPGGGDPLDDITAGTTLDEFDLLIPLGEGAFGKVFLARQHAMQRYVAVKVSRDNSSESQTLAQLDHDHIVRIFDQRQLADTGLRLMYMQYIPGGTLDNVLALVRRVPVDNRSGALLLDAVDTAAALGGRIEPHESTTRDELENLTWPETVAWLGSRLARALDHADQSGILHRDIKPANILLTADGQPKLADFGISFNRLLPGHSPVAYFGGSLRYMSPEQLQACHPDLRADPADLDTRSDLYALAVVLWELLTGRPPFDDEPHYGETGTALDRMIARRRHPINARFQADLPHDCPPVLRHALLTCLSPDPATRFRSGNEFAHQLDTARDRTARDLVDPPDSSLRARFRMKPMPVVTLSSALGQMLAAYYFYAHSTTVLAHDLTATQREQLVDLAYLLALIAYPTGIAVLLYWCRRVIHIPYGLRRGRHYDDDTLARARADTLACGDRIAVVAFVGWMATFTLLLARLLTLAELSPGVLANLIASTLVAAAIAVSYTYFPVTFYVLRWYYPGLLERGHTAPDDRTRLHRLARRNRTYLTAAATVPLLGAAAGLAFLPAAQQHAAIGSVIALCVGGLCGVTVSLYIFHALADDLAAFERLLTPSTER